MSSTYVIPQHPTDETMKSAPEWLKRIACASAGEVLIGRRNGDGTLVVRALKPGDTLTLEGTGLNITKAKAPEPPPVVNGVTLWRKKPIAVNAFKIPVKMAEVPIDQFPNWIRNLMITHINETAVESEMRILTQHGWVNAIPGDWIIQGVNGEIYPCAGDVFAATYEQVPETKSAVDNADVLRY